MGRHWGVLHWGWVPQIGNNAGEERCMAGEGALSGIVLAWCFITKMLPQEKGGEQPTLWVPALGIGEN